MAKHDWSVNVMVPCDTKVCVNTKSQVLSLLKHSIESWHTKKGEVCCQHEKINVSGLDRPWKKRMHLINSNSDQMLFVMPRK